MTLDSTLRKVYVPGWGEVEMEGASVLDDPREFTKEDLKRLEEEVQEYLRNPLGTTATNYDPSNPDADKDLYIIQ